MVRILPVGDSITWGVINSQGNNQEQSGGYRTVLFDSLAANGFTDIDFVGTRATGPDSLPDREHAGYRALRIDEIAAQLTAAVLASLQPEVVLLMAGTNDLLQNFDLANAPTRLGNLIDQIITASPAVRVLVASVPPPGDPTDAALVNATVAFNNAIRNNVQPPRASNVTFVDVYEAMTANDISPPPDDIHPTSLGYSKMATAWQNALLPILDPEINPLTQVNREAPIRFEGEAMNLGGGYVTQPRGNTLPDTPVIALAQGNTGTATGTFNSPTGTYEVVLGYYDEDDGQAQLQVNVGNTVSQTLTLNQDVDAVPGNRTTANSNTYVRRTLTTGALIAQGASIQITGIAEGNEAAVVDYIEFIPVNDAPVLNTTSVQLTSINEDPDPITNNGDLLFNILSSVVTDLDANPRLGIAVIGADDPNGIWQYSTDNGTNWTGFGTLDATTARLLAANDLTRIRFVPNPDYNGTPTGISFRAWDQTKGFAGNTANISAADAVGGSRAFSAETATLTLTVNPVDDPAVNNVPVANPDSATTVQNQAVAINVLSNDTDPDGNALLLASFATTSTAGGTIARDDRGNADPSDDLLLYTPATNFTGTDSFNYTVSDGTDTATATVTVTVNSSDQPPPEEPPPDEPPPDSDGSLRLVHNPDDSFSLEGSPGQAQLRFRLDSRDTDNVNEIGVFAVDDAQGTIDGIAPGSPGYLQAALSRGQVVFSVLPDGFASDNPTRQIEGFNVGTRLGFYLVQDSSTDAVLAGQTASVLFGSPSFNASGFDYLQVEAVNNGGYTLAWNDSAGSGNFDDIVMSVEAIAPSSPLPLGTGLQGGQQQELIDLTASSGLVANFNLNYQVRSRAEYNNTLGLYVVEDELGTVLDPVTGNRIAPGEGGYAEAAIRRTLVQANQEASGSVLSSGILLAPYIIADGTVDEFLADNPNNQSGQGAFAYFAYMGANPDGVDHVRLLGDNRFGFEDVLGGGDRDYNDIVFQVDITVA